MSASIENEADPNLTPLLDLVLQLIMFFMITANFSMLKNNNPNLILPVVQTAVPVDKTIENSLEININKFGKIDGVNKTLDTPEQIQTYLNDQLEECARGAAFRLDIPRKDVKVLVVIRAHEDLRYDKIWEILDQCKKAQDLIRGGKTGSGGVRFQIRGLTLSAT